METTPPAANAGTTGAKTPSRTPGRRAISAEPPSSRRSVHTPLDRTATRDLVNSVRRGTSASGGRRNNAPTPHARAARRALDQRRTAMFTPGKNRRRSQVENRETPMDILRRLGQRLAPTTQPIVSSSPRDGPSSSILPIREEDEDDDELPIDRPRLSLPLDEDDDFDLQPPRSSILDDPDNYTVQSIELPRRAISEQLGSRMSRGSFGSVRMSEIFENDLSDIGQQSDFFPGLLEDLQARAAANDFSYDRLDPDPTRRTTLGRDSDVGLQMPVELQDQSTFVMSEPGADLPPSSPLVDQPETGVVFDTEYGSDGGFPAGDDTEDEAIEDFGHNEQDEDQNQDIELSTLKSAGPARLSKNQKKRKKVSRHGIEYPPLPPAFVKRVAQTALQTSGLSNHRISPDTLTALTQASEWFFEQLGDDLGAYASHAKRKTIEESDIVTLMRRQRQIGSNATMFSLAQRHLPRELLQELRMPVPQPVKTRRSKKARIDDTEEVTEIT